MTVANMRLCSNTEKLKSQPNSTSFGSERRRVRERELSSNSVVYLTQRALYREELQDSRHHTTRHSPASSTPREKKQQSTP